MTNFSRFALVCFMASSACEQASQTRESQGSTSGHGTHGQNSLYVLDSQWKDQNGNALKLSALRGTPRVVGMVYTSCEQACPMLVQSLKRLQAQLPSDTAANLGFVLVSLDPENDTPSRLKDYAAAHGLHDWLLLTSNRDSTRELAVALNVNYAKQQNGVIAHSSGISVLGADGSIIYQESGLEFSAPQVAAIVAQNLAAYHR